MKNKIAVFCGREYGPNKEKYHRIAMDTGRLIAENGYTLATGGGPGMMSDVNQGAFEAGGHVISVQFTFNETVQSPYFSESVTFEDLRERQKYLIEHSDAGIVLPGGAGTLYEAVEILSMKRVHKIPMTFPLIFVDPFYSLLEQFLRLQQSEGFLPFTVDESCVFASTPEDAIIKMNTFFTA